MKILVDILGGDGTSKDRVNGAVLALQEDSSFNLVLIGDKNYAEPIINKAGFKERVEYVHTLENITCEDQPTTAIKQKTGSSMVMGFDMLKKNEDCAAFVSAGSTGALLTGSFMKIGRIEGVSRPTLCPWLPTKRNDVKVILADAGANVDCKPINLVHFALMTDAYVRCAYGIKKPRVGLVNVGTEENKGNELTHQTYPILKALHERGAINFVGNMEARYALSGDYDIVIADGFVGNILLKSSEGAISLVGDKINKICHSSFKNKIGALFLRKGLKQMKSEFHEDATGGSPFLGIKKPVVKAHGNASPRAFKNAIITAAIAAKNDLNTEIKKVLDENKELITEIIDEQAKTAGVPERA